MPLNETAFDRKRQREITEAYVAITGWKFVMMPTSHSWDVEFSHEGRLIAIAEVKHRNVKRLYYPTFKIDQAKITKLLIGSRQRRVTAGLLLGFEDGNFKLTITERWIRENATRSTIKREDRAGETTDPAYEWSNKHWVPFEGAVAEVPEERGPEQLSLLE